MLVEVNFDKFISCIPEREGRNVPVKLKVFAGNFGNFTVVVLQDKNTPVGAGVAKRNPSDRPSDAGFCIAAVRALRDLRGADAGYNRQHPISKAKAKQISVFAHVSRALDDLGLGLGEE
jgi:hypothetical protein